MLVKTYEYTIRKAFIHPQSYAKTVLLYGHKLIVIISNLNKIFFKTFNKNEPTRITFFVKKVAAIL